MCDVAQAPDRAPSCHICLDSEPDIGGEPPRRECGCRGPDGHAHPSCLVERARKRCDAILTYRAKGVDEESMMGVDSAWRVCPTCERGFAERSEVLMAEKYAEYVEGNPGNVNVLLQITAFDGLIKLYTRKRKYEKAERAIERYCRCLDANTNTNTNGGSCDSYGYYVGKTSAMRFRSIIKMQLKQDGARESFDEAYEFAEEHLGADHPETIDLRRLVDQAARTNTDIEGAYPDHSPSPEDILLLDNEKRHVETVKKRCGPDGLDYIRSLYLLTIRLCDVGDFAEGAKVAQKVRRLSRRACGQDHPHTSKLQGDIKLLQIRHKVNLLSDADTSLRATIVGLTNKPDLNGTKIDVLSCTEDAKYIALLGNAHGGKEKKFKADAVNVIFMKGTAIRVHNLISASHLNGHFGQIESYDHENRRYVVRLETDNDRKPIMIKPDNCIALF